MCAVLRETTAEHNIDNVSLIESDWLNAAVEQAEIVLCSHVVYAVQDIGPFVRKLEDSAARAGAGGAIPSPAPVTNIPVVGAGPTARHVCLFPAFRNSRKCWRKWASVPPSVLFPASRREGSTALEDAVDQLTRRLYVAAGSPQAGRLEAVLAEVLEERDGVYRFKDAQPLIPTVVAWEPHRN